jgi:acyl-CoA synthetase (AMP-forming)/AMP-acid ligase II
MSTFVDHLQQNRDRFPDKPAVVCRDRSLTYRELDTLSTHAALNLIARGVTPGDRIALHLLNGTALAVAYYACFKAGVIAVPVNTRLKRAELAYVLDHSGASVYVGQDDLYEELRALRFEKTTVVEWYLTTGSANAAGVRAFDELLAASSAGATLPVVSPDDVAVIVYTSGTTARPKGVTHSHRTLLWWLPYPAPPDPHAVVLLVMPMVHIGGFTTLVTSLAVGATVVIVAGFDPSAVLDAIEQHRVTTMSGTPALFHALVEAQRRTPRDVGSMRAWNVGGDTVPALLQEQFTRMFGRPLREFYGSTEVLPVTRNLFPTNDGTSMGRPVFGIDVRLVDESGADVEAGAVGEIVVRSPGVTPGYWNDPEATAHAIRDGWLYTGDLAHRASDGALRFDGRQKEIIVRGGSNVSPEEVEEVLAQHPAVREVGVTGTLDAILGEIVTACVVVEPGTTVSAPELIAFAQQRLAVYKAPERIVLLEELPKSVAGKLHRVALRTIAATRDRQAIDVAERSTIDTNLRSNLG